MLKEYLENWDIGHSPLVAGGGRGHLRRTAEIKLASGEVRRGRVQKLQTARALIKAN